MSDNDNQLKLDIRGQICPSCLLLTLKEITAHADKINNGEYSVLVISDDRHATATIPDAVHNMGFSSKTEKVDGDYHILISSEN